MQKFFLIISRMTLLVALSCYVVAWGKHRNVFNPAKIPGIEVSSKERPILTAYARGSQNYQCQKIGENYEWVFIGPEAELFDYSGLRIGVHLLGPSWKHIDNSFVLGKLIAQVETQGSIPQLLLSATKTSTRGIFANVSSIQRINPKGGAVPSQVADKKHLGQIVKIPYTATYIFYRLRR